MNIYDFADSINQNLVITRHSNPKIFSETKFTVCFENAEIKQGSILHSTYGRGLDIREALNDYTEQILCSMQGLKQIECHLLCQKWNS